MKPARETVVGRSVEVAEMSDAECFDMLVQMGGGLSWNNQGGFWSCYACGPDGKDGTPHAYGDDPKDVVMRCHAEWLKAGGVGPSKLSDEECAKISADCRLREEAQKRGFACMGIPDPADGRKAS